jgi:hypothetical protein
MTTDLRHERWFLPELRVQDGTLHVQFGWEFRTEIALTSIKDAKPNIDRVFAFGAQGWRGRWLVNGTSSS